MAETFFGSDERDCNKCVHHTSGLCSSWDCKMQTVEDVKREAVKEYAEAVAKELEKIKDEPSGCYGVNCEDCKYKEGCLTGGQDYKVLLDRAISIIRNCGKE